MHSNLRANFHEFLYRSDKIQMRSDHLHYENMPMQYTVIFKIVNNENFQ